MQDIMEIKNPKQFPVPKSNHPLADWHAELESGNALGNVYKNITAETKAERDFLIGKYAMAFAKTGKKIIRLVKFEMDGTEVNAVYDIFDGVYEPFCYKALIEKSMPFFAYDLILDAIGNNCSHPISCANPPMKTFTIKRETIKKALVGDYIVVRQEGKNVVAVLIDVDEADKTIVYDVLYGDSFLRMEGKYEGTQVDHAARLHNAYFFWRSCNEGK